MSRSERRAYRRLTKNQDPYAPPAATAAARARMERDRARRSATNRRPGSSSLLGGRTGWVVFGGGAAAFLLGFSLAWPSGVGLALLAGLAAGIGWLAVTLGFVVWRRRTAAVPADRRIGPR
jgi:hypothetical protein